MEIFLGAVLAFQQPRCEHLIHYCKPHVFPKSPAGAHLSIRLAVFAYVILHSERNVFSRCCNYMKMALFDGRSLAGKIRPA